MLFKLVLLALQQVINRQINCLQCVQVRLVTYIQILICECCQQRVDIVAHRCLQVAQPIRCYTGLLIALFATQN